MMNDLITAWYQLLNGNVTYSSAVVPVYLEDAPADETSHYILLTAEGLTDDSDNSQFRYAATVVVDVVTVHKSNVRRSIADDISLQIHNLVFPVKNVSALPVQAGIQVLNVKQDTSTYLYEDDGVSKYYRHVIRFTQTIIKQ
ncbi:hypothetical protein UFOVP402_15 [uncultured Caudovirales phage]|uniref:Uncharacterized protein n=1 Tax=uncultured Caudovirales phage TaxID=2100421 RepID=A0A6J5M567_9CAUD|nr:hypothetical protein UFOVP402_15 [uncultured Caudovirales phage]